MGTLLRYSHEVRDPQEYFDEIQDVKVTKDMPDLARHIVEQKSGSFEPDKFEDQYETALVDLINQKRAGKPRASCEAWLDARGKTWARQLPRVTTGIDGVPLRRKLYAYGVEINPRAVATIQRLPQRTIESIRPMPGITSPRATIRIPSGPSSTAVPPRTSRTAHPPIVIGLVSGTDRSGPAGSIAPVTDMSASKTEEAEFEASADCAPLDALARGFGARLAITVEG